MNAPVTARWCFLVCTIAACRRDPHDASVATRPREASVRAIDVAKTASASDAARSTVQFAPHWSCRITGPGHTGYGLDGVSVAPPHPNDPAGAVRDAVLLRNHGTVLRINGNDDDAGESTVRGRVLVRDAAGATVAMRAYDLEPGAVEMLFEDERGAGAAWWDGRTLRLLRAETSETEVVEGAGGDPTRACASAPSRALRLVPLAGEPWEFPPVRGMPPSVAVARWTLALDSTGLCVVRLEGEGPWGKVLVRPAGRELRGELWLDESINPVVCGPG